MSFLPVLVQSSGAKVSSFLCSGLPNKVTMNCGSQKKNWYQTGLNLPSLGCANQQTNTWAKRLKIVIYNSMSSERSAINCFPRTAAS